MAKNRTIQTATGTAPAPTTLAPKALTPAAQELLDKAKAEVEAGRSKIKEAKALGKIIVCVATLGLWGLAQLKAAIGTRENELTPKDESADRL